MGRGEMTYRKEVVMQPVRWYRAAVVMMCEGGWGVLGYI